MGFNVSLRPDAFGWDECIVYIMAKIGKRGRFSFKKLSLDKESTDTPFNIPKDELIIRMPDEVAAAGDDKKIYFGLYEVWTKRWKGGLRIYHAYVEEIVEKQPK